MRRYVLARYAMFMMMPRHSDVYYFFFAPPFFISFEIAAIAYMIISSPLYAVVFVYVTLDIDYAPFHADFLFR